MFIMESKTGNAARKWSFMMMIIFLVTGSFGALLTMHFYVRPKAKPNI